MQVRIFALAAALSALAGSAFAYGGPTQATLQHAVSAPVQIIAGDGVWNCAGSACVSGSATEQSLTVSTCKTIVKEAGPVTAFTVNGGSLKDDQITKCNGGAQAQASNK
jgi:hypothetical protein